MTNLASLIAEVEEFADASDAQWANARTWFEEKAPDLMEYLWGER